MATTKQLEWIGKLADDPRLTPKVRARAMTVLGSPSKPVGDLLTVMFGMCPKEKTPKTAGTPDAFKVFGSEFPGIKPGYYAIPHEDGPAHGLRFFKVSFGYQFSKVAAMQDRVFVKLVVGGHPDIKCDAPLARELLGRVDDVFACQQRYGLEIGSCGRCNTPLTDHESIARGFGPDCWDLVTG